MKIFVTLILGLLVAPVAFAQSSLKVVTWNMEHLAAESMAGCKPRSNSDYAALSEYVKKIDADIYALQEVENTDALARVFPPEEYTLFVSGRPSSRYDCRGTSNQSTAQRVGYAVRIAALSADDVLVSEVKSMAMGGSLRYGLSLTLRSANLSLLNVHLKSGCFDGALNSSKTCRKLASQLPLVGDWASNQVNSGRNIVILGDFNRRLDHTADGFLGYVSPSQALSNAVSGVRGCHPKYPKPIDHILHSPELAVSRAMAYDFGDENGVSRVEDMLSDHCPIAVSIQL